jgi:hypothetical protein
VTEVDAFSPAPAVEVEMVVVLVLSIPEFVEFDDEDIVVWRPRSILRSVFLWNWPALSFQTRVAALDNFDGCKSIFVVFFWLLIVIESVDSNK